MIVKLCEFDVEQTPTTTTIIIPDDKNIWNEKSEELGGKIPQISLRKTCSCGLSPFFVIKGRMVLGATRDNECLRVLGDLEEGRNTFPIKCACGASVDLVVLLNSGDENITAAKGDIYKEGEIRNVTGFARGPNAKTTVVDGKEVKE